MRKYYDRDYKIKVVREVIDKRRKILEVSSEFGVNNKTLEKWISDYKKHKEDAFIGSGNHRISDKKFRSLEKQNEILRDIIEDFKCPIDDIYEWIFSHKDTYSVEMMCELFDIPRSSFYEWKKKRDYLLKQIKLPVARKLILSSKTRIIASINRGNFKAKGYRRNEWYNQARVIRGKIELTKHEMIPGGISIFVIPKRLCLPFNPVDPNDNNHYEIPCSCSTFIKALKKEISSNYILRRYYEEKHRYFVDINTCEDITKNDMEFFNQYTQPLVISNYTQKLRLNLSSPFIKERLVNLGSSMENSLPYELYKLEQDIIKLCKYKDKPVIVSPPKESGVCLFYEFPCNKNSEELIINDSVLWLDNLTYISCNEEEKAKIMIKHNKHMDNDIDFFIYQVCYPKEVMTPLSLYKTRVYTQCESFQNIFERCGYLRKNLITYIDSNYESDRYSKLVEKNITKFKSIDNKTLIDLVGNHIESLGEIITEDINLRYKELKERFR